MTDVAAEDSKELIGEIFEGALEHTGDPEEGDYLRFQYENCTASAKPVAENGEKAVLLTYSLSYYDNAEHEDSLDEKVEAILGSLDRFMAYLIEETKGRFPVWLAPVQVKVLPVSEKFMEYASQCCETLLDAGFRAELDERNEKIGYKIREAQQVERVPYMLIIGQKETDAQNVTYRNRDTGESTTSSMEEFMELLRR